MNLSHRHLASFLFSAFLLPLSTFLLPFSSFAAAPHRPTAVSLAPSLTEIVCAVGAESQLVARSSACDYPPSIKRLPEAGGFGRPNLEAIARFRPDFVLLTDLENPAVLDGIRAAGATPVKLPCESWDQMLAAAEQIGRLLDCETNTTRWVRDMRARRTALDGRVTAFLAAGHARPRVYLEVWGDPMTTAGRTSFVGDLIAAAGGTNVGASLSGSYAVISPEWILRENPDALVCAYMGQAPSADVKMEERPGWQTLTAVRDRRICSAIPPDLLLRPGPRWIEGAEQLADWLEKTTPRK